MTKLTPHWTAEIFPLNESDVERLADDIAANGQRTPILTFKGEILDGRTRLAACKKAGVDPILEEYVPKNGEPTDDELLALSWTLNEARRHLSTSQRACAAAEVAERMPVDKGGRPRKGENSPTNRKVKAWGTFNVSQDIVAQARVLLHQAPKLFTQVKAGELAVGAAFKLYEEAQQNANEAANRASLANLRKINQSLAEDVETGRKTMAEASAQADLEEAARRENEAALGKLATALFVALSGLGMVAEKMAELKVSETDLVATRRDYQRKDDSTRYALALNLLTKFKDANENLNG